MVFSLVQHISNLYRLKECILAGHVIPEAVDSAITMELYLTKLEGIVKDRATITEWLQFILDTDGGALQQPVPKHLAHVDDKGRSLWKIVYSSPRRKLTTTSTARPTSSQTLKCASISVKS